MTTSLAASLRLAQQKEKMIKEWETCISQRAALASDLKNAKLRSNMQDVLDIMAAALSANEPQQILSVQEKLLGTAHGRIRAEETGYSLAHVIDEYRILQQVVLEFLEHDDVTLLRTERDLILEVISIATRNAATEFMAVQERRQANVQQEMLHTNSILQRSLAEKSSESALKDQLLKTIFERVEDYALFSLDAQGHIANWSIGCEKIKLYSADDVLGKHYSMLYPPEGRYRNEPNKHLDIAATQGRFRGEGLRMRKNGELFLADVFISPMYEGTELVGFFKIVADTTERNRLFQEMDLTRVQVKELKLENELREHFIQMLSHDLRTPLSAASMSAQMISRQDCSVAKHHEMAERCAQHIKRVDDMIVDLLDASRIKEGEKFPITIKEFDLVEIVSETCAQLATLMGDRFKTQMPARLIGFWDAKGLIRVIENLVTNAVKYGDTQREITVTLNEVEDRVIMKVHNFGLPIATLDQGSLFEKFHRTTLATRGENKGWGLGLALVRGITEAHGGIVKVRSLPGEGTTFMLDLPRDSRIKAA